MTGSKPFSGLDYTAKSPETGFRSKCSRPACGRQVQCTEISSKLKAQRAIVINPFQLSASGFQLLCHKCQDIGYPSLRVKNART